MMHGRKNISKRVPAFCLNLGDIFKTPSLLSHLLFLEKKKPHMLYVARRKGVEWRLFCLARSDLEWEGEFLWWTNHSLKFHILCCFCSKMAPMKF